MKKNRDIILIFGKTGTGKSTLARSIITDYDRVIVIDPMEEYDGLIFYDFESLLEYHKNNKLESFTYVCRFDNDLDIEYAFKFCEVVTNVLLVVEECSIYVSPYSKSNYFLRLVKFGRHKAISILGISRRTTELHLDLQSNTDKIISFKQNHPKDIENMKKLGLTDLENLISLSDVEFTEPKKDIHYREFEF